MLTFFSTQTPTIQRTTYRKVQSIGLNEFILINTIMPDKQKCLIYGTVSINNEENLINDMLNNIHIPNKPVIIYGCNSYDESVYTKYIQLQKLGLTDVAIYTGGLFEWLLLQDVYGNIHFPTIGKVDDILEYS